MSTQPFSKTNPFLASIKERRWLTKPGSMKNTCHIVLDLQDAGFQYRPGDSIGIFPINSPELVALTLQAMNATGNELVTDKNGEGSYRLADYLANKANLTDISRKFLNEIIARQKDSRKKEEFERLLDESNKVLLKDYLERHQVWDILQSNESAIFTPQEIVNLLMPLLPRLYSIASSQRVVGNEVHLAISRLSYESNSYQRHGICTYYLCDMVPLNQPVIPIYIQEHHGFTTPEDHSSDIIMIGPGTGVAPFKAFMEERVSVGAQGRNWLFFGECHRAYDFFYEEYWSQLESEGRLIIDTAFSRDQEHKLYVQHLMHEKGAELYAWLESGATLYVCGDANRMAKDVDATLHRIVTEFGGLNELEAKAYMKNLRTQKRYLRDIY